MGSKRLERLSSQIVREISDILRRKVSDPRLSWVTITRADVSPDLSVARVYVSSLAEGDERALQLEALHHAEGFMRHEIGQRLELRVTPAVHFFWDADLERASKVMQLLNQIKPKTTPEEDEPAKDKDQ